MGFKQYSFKEYDGMVHSSNDQVISSNEKISADKNMYLGNKRCHRFYQTISAKDRR
jgi:hypothetical protein